jgi:hypothetical protein
MKGYRRPLTQKDIIPMDNRDKAGYLLSKYEICWEDSESTSREW